jgi:hypothetical protein
VEDLKVNNEINIMDIDVNNLKQKQYDYLKNHAINILAEIIDNLEHDQLQAIQYKLKFSSSGDGWGQENYYINFGYKELDYLDLHDIITKMAELKGMELAESE